MKIAFAPHKRTQLNRRAFLRGVGTVAIGLPFLESMPWRSAWAQDGQPVFSFFLCHANGVVGNRFWPSETGPLTGLAGQNKAVSKLADYADRLLIVGGMRHPGNSTGCGHAQGLCQVLTGANSNGGGGNSATSTRQSIDTDIANAVNPSGLEPLTLYAGLKGGYINERLSFSAAGRVRSAEANPYNIYKNLVGLVPTGSPAPTQEMVPVIDELAVRRNSVNDLVREELNNLKAQSVLSRADRDRLDRHLEGIRDIEASMGSQGLITGCSSSLLNESDFSAVSGSERRNGMQEQVSILHMQLVAFAFACNLNRTATLQVGDGTDATVYDVPSNSRRWGFHHVSHRMQSDGAAGNDATALEAHAEIDVLRMENFKKGIDAFASYSTATGDLLDNSILMWTSCIADGPSHSFNNLPIVLVGSGGGKLKQGQYVTNGSGGFNGGVSTEGMLNTLKSIAGASGGGSSLDSILA